MTCSYFLQGRCRWGMSGRRPIKEAGKVAGDCDECPYEHPRVCSKLLNHGDSKHSKYGCDGNSCKKAHPTMCTPSMWSRKCWKLCDKGWHVKGTKFDDGKVPVQNVRQDIQKNQNTASTHDFPPLGTMQPLWNGKQNQAKYENAHQNHPQPPMETMQPLWNRNQNQTKYNNAYQNQPQPNLSVPPPALPDKDNNFKCMDCLDEFKCKTEFRRHINTKHNDCEAENDASFLEAVQKSLVQILPKALETCLLASGQGHSGFLVQNQTNLNPQTGNKAMPMKWGLIPANLN